MQIESALFTLPVPYFYVRTGQSKLPLAFLSYQKSGGTKKIGKRYSNHKNQAVIVPITRKGIFSTATVTQSREDIKIDL